MIAPDPVGVAQLAPHGRIRAAINMGNPATATVAADGTQGGPSVLLARRLAAAIGREVAFVPFDTAAAIVSAEAAGGDPWDIAFLAIDPARGERLVFSKPYLSIEATYAIPMASADRTPADLDRPGRRIASAAGAAYDLHLQRTLRAATLVRRESPNAAIAAFRGGAFDAVAGLRLALDRAFAGDGGVRVLAEAMMAIEHAIAVPRRNAAAAALVDTLLARIGDDRIG